MIRGETMRPVKALEIWREECEKHNIEWFIYKETLLCAEGLKAFPNELEFAQVAIGESDILVVLNEVCTSLEENFNSNKNTFWDSRELVFTDGDGKVLTVSVIADELSQNAKIERITADGKEYPVLSGYREYLSEVYGDYENGLHDNIGVGLTTEDKEALLKHQERCLEALNFLKSVADENGLSYCLLAGSVLGAVRHGGFIPWDDDIDVGIRIENMDKLEEALKKNISRLPSGFTLEQAKPHRNYPRMFSKICFNGRCCIDLWPLTPTYFGGFKAKLIWFYGKMIAKLHYYKLGKRDLKYLKLVRFLCLFLSDKQIMALSRHNERRYVKKNAPAYINLYSVYSRSKETVKREWLDSCETGCFGGIEVPLMGCTDEYLTRLYGDYMKLPAPWNRASRHVEMFLTESSESN